MKKRLFIAIPLPGYLKDALAECEIRYPIPGLRWVGAENLHITVLFLGYTDEEILPMVEEKARIICSGLQPFSLAFERLCFAPPGRPARMIWAVFLDGGEYKDLSQTMYNALREFGFPDTRNKESIVHITLARFREPSVAKAVKLQQPEIQERAFEVTSCQLVESKLMRSGAEYKVIARFAFEGGRE
jgi:2'-5' RNA ligase